MKKITLLLLFLLLSFEINSKTITGLEYGITDNCIEDSKETFKKIDQNIYKPDFRTLSEIYLISFLCKLYEHEYYGSIEEISFFHESVKNKKISYKKNKDIFVLFGLFSNLIIKEYYPILKEIDLNITDKDYLEELKKLNKNKDISIYNTIITLYASKLFDEQKIELASKYLDKLIKNTSNQFDYQNYLLSTGLKVSIFKNYDSKKRQFLSNHINELDDYLEKYGFNRFILLQKILVIKSLIYAHTNDDSFDQETRIRNVKSIIKKYKIKEIYQEIPKKRKLILIDYISLLGAARSGIHGYKEIDSDYEILNFKQQLSLNTLLVHIFINDIIFSKEFYLSYLEKENTINENRSYLEDFLWLASEYRIQSNLNSIEYDNREYSGTYEFAFEIAQLISQNEMNRSVSNILLKHKIKSKNNKNLVDEKNKLEEILLKQSNDLSNEKSDSNFNQSLLEKFISNQKELEKINSKIIKSNPKIYNDFIYPKRVVEILKNLDQDEGLIYFYKGKNRYFVFLLGDNWGNLISFGNSATKRVTNDVLKFIKYSRNINNYYSSNFPYKSAHNIYETFFDWYWLQSAIKKMKHFSIIGGGIFSTFPFWLLLTDDIEAYNKSQISKYPWFSKKYSYSIYTSINDIFFKKNKNKAYDESNEKNNYFENIIDQFKSSKEYDFVGIGNPILGKKSNTNTNQTISLLFKDNNENNINLESLKYFPELPETEIELKEIQSNFDINKTKLFLRESATEENIKKTNLTNAKFVVFATHALISGEIDNLKEPGIVLTPTIKNKNSNEGLLLASEISNLNLINTDLVVLSACNTSFSIDSSSIPLSGLAKSFFLAGSKSIIVTGWSVESESSAYLSSNIFKKAVNEEMTFSKALQQTINEMISKNMHPLMWGPFILVGGN